MKINFFLNLFFFLPYTVFTLSAIFHVTQSLIFPAYICNFSRALKTREICVNSVNSTMSRLSNIVKLWWVFCCNLLERLRCRKPLQHFRIIIFYDGRIKCHFVFCIWIAYFAFWHVSCFLAHLNKNILVNRNSKKSFSAKCAKMRYCDERARK